MHPQQPPGAPHPPPVPPVPPRSPPQPQRPATPKKSGTTSGVFVMLALFLGIGMGGTCATCATLGGGDEIVFAGSDRVGVVELFGAITDGREVVTNIRKFARRDDLVAIVVHIDSPGGAVAPSQEIYDAMRWAAEKKPVVASMGNVAASGGFWASLGADWVFASPGSVTGSIGVITQTPDLRGIAEALHFKMRTFKSGPLKDAGNPFREMTPGDEALFRSLIDDIYEQFVTITAERRNMSVEAVKKVADGRILTGRAALDAGLIDELGGLHAAARKALVLSKIRKAKDDGETDTSTTAYKDLEDPTLIYPRKPSPGLGDLLKDGLQNGVSEGLTKAVQNIAEKGDGPVQLR